MTLLTSCAIETIDTFCLVYKPIKNYDFVVGSDRQVFEAWWLDFSTVNPNNDKEAAWRAWQGAEGSVQNKVESIAVQIDSNEAPYACLCEGKKEYCG